MHTIQSVLILTSVVMIALMLVQTLMKASFVDVILALHSTQMDLLVMIHAQKSDTYV